MEWDLWFSVRIVRICEDLEAPLRVCEDTSVMIVLYEVPESTSTPPSTLTGSLSHSQTLLELCEYISVWCIARFSRISVRIL